MTGENGGKAALALQVDDDFGALAGESLEAKVKTAVASNRWGRVPEQGGGIARAGDGRLRFAAAAASRRRSAPMLLGPHLPGVFCAILRRVVVFGRSTCP